jgi:hypothetical protein
MLYSKIALSLFLLANETNAFKAKTHQKKGSARRLVHSSDCIEETSVLLGAYDNLNTTSISHDDELMASGKKCGAGYAECTISGNNTVEALMSECETAAGMFVSMDQVKIYCFPESGDALLAIYTVVDAGYCLADTNYCDEAITEDFGEDAADSIYLKSGVSLLSMLAAKLEQEYKMFVGIEYIWCDVPQSAWGHCWVETSALLANSKNIIDATDTSETSALLANSKNLIDAKKAYIDEVALAMEACEDQCSCQVSVTPEEYRMACIEAGGQWVGDRPEIVSCGISTGPSSSRQVGTYTFDDRGYCFASTAYCNAYIDEEAEDGYDEETRKLYSEASGAKYCYEGRRVDHPGWGTCSGAADRIILVDMIGLVFLTVATTMFAF